MDREWRDEWVRALRSGEFEQAKGVLTHVGYGFCCLGVLCQIRPDVRWVDDVANHDGRSASATTLPDSLGDALGLSTKEQVDLAAMNDRGERFSTIANWIEAHL